MTEAEGGKRNKNHCIIAVSLMYCNVLSKANELILVDVFGTVLITTVLITTVLITTVLFKYNCYYYTTVIIILLLFFEHP